MYVNDNKTKKMLVEAAGVEPASEKVNREKTTCVSDSVFFVHPMRNRQEGRRLSLIDLGFRLQTEALGLSCKMTLLRPVQAHRPRAAT